MRNLNVLVADSHPIFVEGLQSVLARPTGKFAYSVKGVANSAGQVYGLLSQTETDLLLLDINLPETDGLKLLPSLKRNNHRTRVLIMTDADDPRMVKAAFRAGADGYMLKTGSKEELFDAIEEVIEGNTYLGKGVQLLDTPARTLPGGGEPSKRFAGQYGLTRREIEIMCYIGQAMNNKEIAEKLYISDQTVSVHRKNIMRKIGVNNTSSLIKMAYENNLV